MSMSELRTEMEMKLQALKAESESPPYSCGAVAPALSARPRLALCGAGAHWREGHISPSPASFTFQTQELRRERRRKGTFLPGYQRWHFLASSSFFKKFNILCSVLHETELGLGQGWVESLESSVGRSFVTLSKPTTPFPHTQNCPLFCLSAPFYILRGPGQEQDVSLSVPSLTLLCS